MRNKNLSRETRVFLCFVYTIYSLYNIDVGKDSNLLNRLFSESAHYACNPAVLDESLYVLISEVQKRKLAVYSCIPTVREWFLAHSTIYFMSASLIYFSLNPSMFPLHIAWKILWRSPLLFFSSSRRSFFIFSRSVA